MRRFHQIRRRIERAWQALQNQVVGSYELLVDHTRRSDAGVRVTGRTILEYAPIYYSVCKMGGHIGTMPKVVKARRGGDIVTITSQESPLVDLLNLQPNNFMTAMDLFETVQKDAIISGNGRIGIIRDSDGFPTTLIHIHPDFAFVFISYPDTSQTVSGRTPFGPILNGVAKWHQVTGANGEQFVLPDSDVIHIKGLQHDGLEGMPLFDLARNSVGGGLAAEKHVNKTLTNNGVPGLILEAPAGVLTDKDKAKEFLDSFREMHEGGDNASRTGLLRFGVTARALSVSGRDAQLIENRKFTRDEAWLWTGDILFFDGGSAYANQQERDEAYKTHTLGRWVSKWEAELNLKLLNVRQRQRGWFIDLDQTAILRGSLKSRLEAYEIARRIGYLSQEETRELDGLPKPDPTENFQNPNTSSSSAPPPEPEPEPVVVTTVEGGEGAEGALRLPAPTNNRKRLAGFLKGERAAMVELSKHPRTFGDQAGQFYTSNEPKILEIAAANGISSWSAESQRILLQASECQPDELNKRVYDATKSWPRERVAKLLEN